MTELQESTLGRKPLTQKIWILFICASIAKLVIGIFLPFSFDEAYYWVWSHHPHLGYYDHPGMVSWIFMLGHPLEAWAQAARIPFLILGQATLLLWLIILRDLKFSDQQRWWWLLLAVSSPLLGLGTLLALPDIPLLFFSSLAVLFFLRSLSHGSLGNYIFCGLSLGLAFDSKYHLGLVVLSLIIFLVSSGQWRRARFLGIVLCTLSALIASLPVWLWNIQHHWQSFTYQLNHGLGSSGWSPEWTLGYIGGEFLILFPTVAYFAWKGALAQKKSMLFSLCIVPFAFFLLTSFKGIVELNWPITAYPAALALAVVAAPNFKKLSLSVWTWTLAASFVLVHIFFPFLNQPTDKLNEVHYFDPIKPFVEKYSPLYMGSYQMASVMTFQYKKEFWKLPEISRHDFFDEEKLNYPQEKKYFVIKEPWVNWPTWVTESHLLLEKLGDIPPKFELWQVQQP